MAPPEKTLGSGNKITSGKKTFKTRARSSDRCSFHSPFRCETTQGSYLSFLRSFRPTTSFIGSFRSGLGFSRCRKSGRFR